MLNESKTHQTVFRHSSRFDSLEIIKGAIDEKGKVHKIKSVGFATGPHSSYLYCLFLKTFAGTVFYLTPEREDLSRGDFALLIKARSKNHQKPPRSLNVGHGWFMRGLNEGLVHLHWDLFGDQNIYLRLRPDAAFLEPEETCATHSQVDEPSSKEAQ